jgi:hypothetical protein
VRTPRLEEFWSRPRTPRLCGASLELNQSQKVTFSFLSEESVNKKAEEILSGFDRMLEKTEAMPVTPEEKRRLIKEWLRSRLAEIEIAPMGAK